MKLETGKTYFSKDHEWIMVQDQNLVAIGITDFAQASLGDIVFLELPEKDAEYSQGDSFGVVESIKSVSDIYAPVGLKVSEVNSELTDSPQKLNEDAPNQWLIKGEVSSLEVSDSELMDEASYKNFCENG